MEVDREALGVVGVADALQWPVDERPAEEAGRRLGVPPHHPGRLGHDQSDCRPFDQCPEEVRIASHPLALLRATDLTA
jgi:hypothetical protein